MGTPPKYQAPDADKQKSEKKANAKKPIYKRVWFWVVVIVVLAAIGGNGNKNNTSTTPVASSREAVATTAATSSPATTDSQEPKVDKSKLANAVNQYSSTPSDGWTPESWQVFSDALSKAKTVNESEDATQEEVDTAYNNLFTAIGALVKAFNPDDYAQPAYKDVARNPDSYKGQKVAFTGKVLQVVEGTSETDLRVATDGAWDDIVFVGYDPSILGGTRVLEDDSVTIYGTCIGQYSYTSGLGAKISLPGIYADKVVIN